VNRVSVLRRISPGERMRSSAPSSAPEMDEKELAAAGSQD